MLHKQFNAILKYTRDGKLPYLLAGSQYLVWYFRSLGAKIGSKVGLVPAAMCNKYEL